MFHCFFGKGLSFGTDTHKKNVIRLIYVNFNYMWPIFVNLRYQLVAEINSSWGLSFVELSTIHVCRRIFFSFFCWFIFLFLGMLSYHVPPPPTPPNIQTNTQARAPFVVFPDRVSSRVSRGSPGVRRHRRAASSISALQMGSERTCFTWKIMGKRKRMTVCSTSPEVEFMNANSRKISIFL